MSDKNKKNKKGFFNTLFSKKQEPDETEKKYPETNQPVIKQAEDNTEIWDLPNGLQFPQNDRIYDFWKYWQGNDGNYDPLEYIGKDLEELFARSIDNEAEKLLLSEYEMFASEIRRSIAAAFEIIENTNMLAAAAENTADIKETGAEPAAENETDAKKAGPEPVDLKIYAKRSKNNMLAWIFILPPLHGADEITLEKIREELAEENIVYGIREDILKEIVDKKLYFKLLTIAEGKPHTDGTNGEIIEVVPREISIKIEENDEGQLDYKELNLIRSVHKGDVLCEIVKPTPPEDGTDVCGKEVKGRKGIPAVIPKGKNTVLSEDGLQLLSMIDGHINVTNNIYGVENVLTVPGDVDISTGNITFEGDIVVMGNVSEGFSVTSEGSISIKGNVGPGATITAGKNLTISQGVNGGARGILMAGENIKSKYIESCKVNSGASVEAESIIDSHVECDDELRATRGKGVIIGGKYYVGKLVEARTIGNEKSSIPTEITLGVMPNMLRARNEAKEKFDEAERECGELSKNIAYLKNLGDKLTPERTALFKKLLVQLKMALTQKDEREKELARLNEELENIGYCRIKASMAYPGLTVKIGGEMYNVQEPVRMFEKNNSEEQKQ